MLEIFSAFLSHSEGVKFSEVKIVADRSVHEGSKLDSICSSCIGRTVENACVDIQGYDVSESERQRLIEQHKLASLKLSKNLVAPAIEIDGDVEQTLKVFIAAGNNFKDSLDTTLIVLKYAIGVFAAQQNIACEFSVVCRWWDGKEEWPEHSEVMQHDVILIVTMDYRMSHTTGLQAALDAGMPCVFLTGSSDMMNSLEEGFAPCSVGGGQYSEEHVMLSDHPLMANVDKMPESRGLSYVKVADDATVVACDQHFPLVVTRTTPLGVDNVFINYFPTVPGDNSEGQMLFNAIKFAAASKREVVIESSSSSSLNVGENTEEEETVEGVAEEAEVSKELQEDEDNFW
eukprot:TRINITY_DN4276_c0_g1_i2.p1 TRINITY_DN4276_c0_g1~~TRINITY_DN4276_c0_g1_i2.p1  ORF type:complete len:345 (-),score=90.89 TRINITY_DN4276_c0_g1_i2:272-1306(-)